MPPGSRVLDVGCGDGGLLELLQRDKGVDGRGIEISQNGVNDCVARGLSVIQGDADTDLVDYPDEVFDFVILSRPCRRRATRATCWSICCASASGRSSRSRISAIGGSWAVAADRAACR